MKAQQSPRSAHESGQKPVEASAHVGRGAEARGNENKLKKEKKKNPLSLHLMEASMREEKQRQEDYSRLLQDNFLIGLGP